MQTIKKQLFEKYYDYLNSQQKKAVFAVNGPVLVIAGAGSGKTTVLVNRIAHIIRYGNAYESNNEISATEDEISVLKWMADDTLMPDKNAIASILTGFSDDPCPPDRILAITFTNKAAGEIKSRLTSVLGDGAGDIWTGTFHSICVRLLRRFGDYTQIGKNFTIYDQDDCKKVITAILKDLNIEDAELTPKYAANVISNAKNALLSPNEFEKENEYSEKRRLCAKIYHAYQKRLTDANAVDFDDLIFYTVKLLQNEEKPRSWCQNKFRYILVDEYQDTNYSQYLLIKIIGEKHQNIMVVGDDDQSIYKFRGAVVENILNFDKEFVDTRTIYLEENYRSTGAILDAANHLIAHNESRKAKTLRTNKMQGTLPRYHQLADQEKEAVFLAESIEKLLLSQKYNYRDIAILYRTRAQANILETVFSKSAIPHRLLAGLRFYDHAEVKDILSFLRYMQNPNDFISLSRIINVPRRGIGPATLEKLRKISEETSTEIEYLLRHAQEIPELKRNHEKFQDFIKKIDCFRNFSENHLPSETVRFVIDESHYLDTLLNDEDEERRKNVQELISSALFYESKNEDASLTAFLEEIALVSDVDNYDAEANSVVMMTIHAAKGLEFPVVFLVGMEENLFPSPQSSQNESDLEEERRLAYVAMTRAEHILILTGAYQRMLYGKTNLNPISRFVMEIDPKYMELHRYIPAYDERQQSEYQTSAGLYHYRKFGVPAPKVYGVTTFERKMSKENPYGNEFSSRSVSSPQKEISVFRENDRVLHTIFGKGTVLEAKKMGSDTLYRILFDSAGEKKLMASYAKLKPES